MDLTAETVGSAVERYPDVQPLSAVERDHLEMLPDAFADGDFGWRDAEWVVRWFYRRHLGAVPDTERRAAEDAYGENSLADVRAAVAAATEEEGVAERIGHLTALAGVDVPVAAAFLGFLDPARYLPVGRREWGALREAGELTAAYPDPPAVADYERYLATARAVADRCDCDPWDLYRALWVLSAE